MGIDAVLGAIALLGLILLGAGIVSTVIAVSQGQRVRTGSTLGVLGLVIAVVFGILSQGVVVVEPRQIGVVFNVLTGEMESPRSAGTHFILPVVQEFVLYPINQQQITMSGIIDTENIQNDDTVRTRSRDGQEIYLDVSVIYSLNPTAINDVHLRWQTRYETELLLPTIRGYVRAGVSRFRAEDIYGGERQGLETSVETALANRFAEEGILLSDFLIRDTTFSDEYTQAVEQAQIAQQDTERARLQVEQRLQEAQQTRVIAEGERDASITLAQGDAQSIIIRAEALELVSQELLDNPALIPYRYVQNLSDTIRLILVPANEPFLFSSQPAPESAP